MTSPVHKPRPPGLRLIALALTLGLVVAFPTIGRAQISSDDLFLAPTEVPIDFYSATVLSPGGSIIYSADDVLAGSSLLSVRILPLLNPNPAGTPDGVYTPGDLAGISVGNYSSFFFRQPNADYFASNIASNMSTVNFASDGQYFVQLRVTDGMTEASRLFNVQVDDFFAEDPAAGAADKTGPTRRFAAPTTDLVIISDMDPNDNGAMANAMTQLPGAAKASTIDGVKQAIMDAFNANGMQKISVTLIGHGRPGSIKIGTERINNDTDGTITASDFQEYIDEFVSSIEFYSCSTGAGADGRAFLDDIAASLGAGRATAFDDTLTISKTYFDLTATGQRVRGVPEPAAFVLLALGGGGLLVASRWRRRGRPLQAA